MESDVRKALSDSAEALGRVVALESRADVIESTIGQPPNPLRQFNGTGLHETMYGLKGSIDGLSSTIARWEKTLAAREATLVKIGWIIASTLIVAAVGAGLAYLSGFRRMPDATQHIQGDSAESTGGAHVVFPRTP